MKECGRKDLCVSRGRQKCENGRGEAVQRKWNETQKCKEKSKREKKVSDIHDEYKMKFCFKICVMGGKCIYCLHKEKRRKSVKLNDERERKRWNASEEQKKKKNYKVENIK